MKGAAHSHGEFLLPCWSQGLMRYISVLRQLRAAHYDLHVTIRGQLDIGVTFHLNPADCQRDRNSVLSDIWAP